MQVDGDSSYHHSNRQIQPKVNPIPEAPEREEMTVVETLSNQLIEFPITPERAKKRDIADKYLTDGEKGELSEFDQIFYMCENTAKYSPTKMERLVNNGHDDDEGYYRI